MPARIAFALALIAIAASAHWLIFPFTQGRIPFLLFVPAIMLATAAAGRGPGLLVLLAGTVNATMQLAPTGRFYITGTVDRFSLLAFILTGLFLVFIGHRLRTISRREYDGLREADRRKDEFLATLAHELRNPLAPIRQAALVAASERAGDAQKRWACTVIERQVQHMSLLLDDLLDVSRITRGALALRKQQVGVQAVVGAAVETARPLIDSRCHQLVIDVPETLQIHCDPLRLAQVFANLLTNAAKYTPAGGTIRLVAEQSERLVVVRVIDNGIGLRAEDMPRLFQMFSQAGSADDRSDGGLGIGLALTKGLVEMHDGSIEVQSAGLGQGCAFTVRLPIGEVVPMAVTTPVDEPEMRLMITRSVLIADDNRDAADTLAMVLQLEGYDVVVAHDGHAALSLFERHRPEVALLDVGMPGLNGYEVAQRIRARVDGAQVLLIAVTGWGQEKDRRQSAEAGFDHHLTKPVEPDFLIRLLQPARQERVAAG